MSSEETDQSAPEGAPPAGRRARRQAEIRARLIAAGREIFTRQGLDEATIAQITAEADVGFGTFYLYFPSKEALYRAVVGTGFRRLGDRLHSVMPSDGEPWPVTLRAGVETLFRFAAENRDLFLLMFAGRELGAAGAGGGGGARGPIAEWVSAMVMAAARAECAAGDAPADEVLDLLTVGTVAMLRRAMAWWMRNDDAADESPPPAAVAAPLARFLVAGLAAALSPEPGAMPVGAL